MWELAKTYMKKWLEWYCRQEVSIGEIVQMTDMVNAFLEWIKNES